MKSIEFAKLSKRDRNKFDGIVQNVVTNHCHGIQINILDIPKVFKAAHDEWDRQVAERGVNGMAENASAVSEQITSVIVAKYRELSKGGA